MDKRELVLMALAPAGGAIHSPVQIQKLLFLIDYNIHELVDGPHFNFQPYSYGPFDKSVYRTLETLEEEGLVVINADGSYNRYRLTAAGQQEGDRLLNQQPEKVRRYFAELSAFVRSLSFSQLVRAIYKAYPEMKVNSVFQG